MYKIMWINLVGNSGYLGKPYKYTDDEFEYAHIAAKELNKRFPGITHYPIHCSFLEDLIHD